MWWERYKRRLEVLATGGAWIVERDGRPVALLTRPTYVDYFWQAWHIELLAVDPAEREALLTETYWAPENDKRMVYRSKEFGTTSAGFPALEKPVRDGRLVIRGLYHPVSGPWFWESYLIWLRRCFKRTR
jgi:hypothetical protein